jgi:hypothetical protein
VAVLLCPWPTRVAPEWEIQALGPGGEPIPYLLVRQRWRDATAMGDQLERTRMTDSIGRVSFPSRWAWGSSIERGWRLIRLGEYCSVHFAEVYLWDIGYSTGVARYAPGEPLPRVVRLHADTSGSRPAIGGAARLAQSGGAGRPRHQCPTGESHGRTRES